MIGAQKELMFRFYNRTKKQWEFGYEQNGGLCMNSYEEIEGICGNLPDKGDTIEVDQFLNIYDKNKVPLYEGDYFKFQGGSIIYVVRWDSEEKKNVYSPVAIPSKVVIDVRELVAPLFEIVGNIHEGVDEKYYDLMKQYFENNTPSEFYNFLDS